VRSRREFGEKYKEKEEGKRKRLEEEIKNIIREVQMEICELG